MRERQRRPRTTTMNAWWWSLTNCPSIVASTAGVPVAAGGRTLPANAPCAPCVRHSLVLKSEGRTPGFFTISFRSPY